MSNEERLAILETTNAHILDSLSRIESKLNYLDNKIDNKFDTLDKRMWTSFYFMIGGFAGVLTLIAHGFHWIP